MLEILFWLLVGAFIGWHVPEPIWAKVIKTKVVSFFKKEGT
jgi:hypothetical protein